LCHCSDSQVTMSFVVLLYARREDSKSIRKILAAFGVTKWSTLSKPLGVLAQEEVIALLCSWCARELRPGQNVTLRIIEENTRGVYEVELQAKKGCLYVTRLYPRPDLKGQLLYCWPINFKLESLSQQAIKNSLQLADEMLDLEISSDETDEAPKYVIM